MHASTEPNSQSVCETRIRRRFHLCLGCIGVIIFQLLPACILFHRNQHVWNLAQVWAALIITTRQNLLRQTSIFATGPFKRNIVLLYTVPSVIHIIFGTCIYLPEEPVLSNSIGTCTAYERSEYWANTSLGSSVYCTYGSVLSFKPRDPVTLPYSSAR